MHEGQPIEYASCALTKTQTKYAQIEKGFLAVQYGLKRFATSLSTPLFFCQTPTSGGHKPLLSKQRLIWQK